MLTLAFIKGNVCNLKDYRYYEGLRPQRILAASPPLRRRQGPITRQPSASEEIRLACVKGDLIAVQNLIESKRFLLYSACHSHAA